MHPIIISFYTRNSPYQLHAHQLQASCEKFGIPSCIEGIDSWGSWELNCAYKPFFIAEKLSKLGSPVLWVDADAIVVRRLRQLQVFKKDFALYVAPELAWDHSSKVRSGTLYVNTTEEGRNFLRQWEAECYRQLSDPSRQEQFWDQIALRNVIKAYQSGVGCLPLTYIHIAGHPTDEQMCSRPTIVHLQASRIAKK